MMKQVDVVVVGSGPGGATVARGLAQAGRKVLLLEEGRRHRWLGNHLTATRIADRAGLSFSEEGMHIVAAHTLGGSTIMYCGTATRPPAWLKDKYGIDLTHWVDETHRELKVQKLPDEVMGTAAIRLHEAANELGYDFERFEKFIDPSKCRSHCGGTCMLGCPYGAKWTAREYVDDMIRAGGEVLTKARVSEVIVEDGMARGVRATTSRGELVVRADLVVIAAGGLGTPTILQRSGIHEAGVGMFIDPLVFVTGVSRHKGTALGPPMAIGTYEMIDEGIVISDLIDPWGIWLFMTGRSNPRRLRDFLQYRKMMGLMVKIGDERQGFITLDRRISKPLTEQDRYRLNRGAAISREILIKAGCRPDSVIVGPVRGAHPGATARIGSVVDKNLCTRFKGLYVADASVLPEALDRPTVLTIISLAKRLVDHLIAG
jgi:choline dehydrogenase-like flavoprotein